MNALSHSSTPLQGETACDYLVIRDLWKSYGSFMALKDINLNIGKGEFICFLGPSGCGKTTLLRAIAGLDLQTRGSIAQQGRDISTLPPSARDYGIVFQSYALFPNLTIAKNVAFGLENTGVPRAQIKARVQELLTLVGLADKADTYPTRLSGGQQQRIALARAIAINPGLLLLDEPLSALDAKVRVKLRHEIKELQRRLGVTTIMVTHDQDEALSMADRIVVMNHGVIEQIGTPTDIYRNPSSLFVADFVGETNRIPTRTQDGRVKLGSFTLRSTSRDMPMDGDVTLTVRPEDILAHARGHLADMPENHLPVALRTMEFMGSFWRCYLVSPALGDAELVANFSMNAVRRLGLSIGDDMTVELPAERVLIFK